MSKSKKSAILHYASSETDADLLYLAGFRCGDPFVYAHVGRKRYLIVTDFEVGRAGEESDVDEVIALSVLAAKAGGIDLYDAALQFLNDKGVGTITVPEQFPIGIAKRFETDGIAIEIVEGPFVPERATKNSYEVKLIKETQRKAEKAMEAAIQWIRSSSVRRGTLYVSGKPLTSEMVRKRIELQLMEAGCLATHTIVACGDDGIDPHNVGSGALRANKPIIVDIFPRSLNHYYWADITRTVVKGKATPTVKKMFRAVREGQRIAMTMIKPGARADLIHKAIHDHFEETGFQTQTTNGRMEGFIHGTGHGVGLDIHEMPRVSKAKGKLRAGHVITVEPGLYYKGHGGIRLEDLILVTPEGGKNLTRFAKILEV